MVINILGLKIAVGKEATTPKPTEETKQEDLKAIAPNSLATGDSTKPVVVPDPTNTPTALNAGIRSSIPDVNGLVHGYADSVAQIKPDFAIEMLNVLQHLAKYNADISYAVDNLVQLGSTQHKIDFGDDVSDEDAKKMSNHIKAVSKNWYANSDVNGLVRDLLTQAVVSGAISGEIVPNSKLKGVQYVTMVNPSRIRFVYDLKDGQYHPYQVINSLFATATELLSGNASTLGLHQLNQVTYKYIAVRRFSENPYAIPSFLSAIESTIIERDMMNNFASVIKRMGLLGFLHVLLTPPQRAVGETDEQYQSKCNSYIQKVIPEVDKSMNKGYVVGFKGSHEFQMESVAQNVGGVKELHDINTIIKMAGLKQDPSMLGKNFTTTETLGRVLLTKLSTQVVHFQQVVAAFLSDMYELELRLAGFKFSSIEVKFDAPLLGDAAKDETTRKTKIENLKQLYNDGIISLQQYALEMGYDKPDQEEPRVSGVPITTSTPPKKSNGDTAPTDNAQGGADVSSNSIYELDLTKNVPRFDYSEDCVGHDSTCSHTHTSDFKRDFVAVYQLTQGGEEIAKHIDEYYTDTVNNYNKAIDKATLQIGNALIALGDTFTLEMAHDAVFSSLYRNWGKNFSEPQQAYINKHVEAAYRSFRSDKSVFGVEEFEVNGQKVTVPEASFNLTDQRTINYYKKSDSLYLGRFITDEDTKKKITKFIKDEYVANNLEIGKSPKALAKFRKQFGEVLQGEDWKIQRVINTTVNSMRNQGAARYISQAGLTRYKVVGVTDRLQCDYCKSMQGKTFEIGTALDRADRLTASSPEEVKDMNMFVNTIFKSPADMAELTGKQLQLAGVGLPAFHANCRDVIIADI